MAIIITGNKILQSRKKSKIDIVCSNKKRIKQYFFEAKWKELRRKKAEEILKEMEGKLKISKETYTFNPISFSFSSKSFFNSSLLSSLV